MLKVGSTLLLLRLIVLVSIISGDQNDVETVRYGAGFCTFSTCEEACIINWGHGQGGIRRSCTVGPDEEALMPVSQVIIELRSVDQWGDSVLVEVHGRFDTCAASNSATRSLPD